MRGHLIRIDSLGPGGSTLPLLLASVDEPELCHIDNEEWQPNIARLPSLRYDFFGGDFRGQIIAPSGGFSISTDGIADFSDRVFAAARVRLWTGDVGDDWSGFRLLFDGLISGEPEVRAGIATFTMGTDAAWLDTPLLGLYEGTGGIEGGADMTGRTKPLTLGAVRFADAVLIDPVDLVYQVNDGPIEGVTATYDRVASLGSSAGDNANLAALLADTIPPGSWATSNAEGLVRLGAPPDGRVAFDVEGDGGFARKPGEIIAHIASLAGGSTDAANLAALDAARPYNLQIQLAAQTTAREVIQQIADSVCAVAGFTWTGGLFVQPLAIDEDPDDTLAEDGTSDLAVSEVTQLAIAAPYWRLATEAERTWVVYGLGEVATGYNIRGTYSAATEYRLDDVVFADDGRTLAYINATPSAGSALPVVPATSNTHWEQIATGSDWSQISGTGKPEDNATVGAPSGTDVAGRDADTIAGTIAAGGEIATGKVETDSMVSEAVTTKTYAFTAGSVSIASGSYTYQEVQSATITTTGEDVEIDAYFELSVIDNCKYQYRILRDGTPLIDLGPITVNTADGPPAFFRYVDSPSAGTYEYTLEVAVNDGGDINVLNRGLSAKEIKR